ncbi:uncharacterized protein LOC126901566 isoform X1 [Daktulosphaira vitifoliae]|uniref:uncharacterized protein LOC126901566 isoform X1 n=1 Tax=Daktulosphaira vitifoliae TaxID=58002 RepID=UPI0021A9F6D4|nr:uncharacterized protein LOC126901566 isoform X1 [Daktulosphaira vitifoliae]
MFKNKTVLLLFVIYITIAFAVPTNIVEYNNSEVCTNDANYENEQRNKYFPEGHMNAKIMHDYITKFLTNITRGITEKDCQDFIDRFASNPDKGLTQKEYLDVNMEISNWMHPVVK